MDCLKTEETILKGTFMYIPYGGLESLASLPPYLI